MIKKSVDKKSKTGGIKSSEIVEALSILWSNFEYIVKLQVIFIFSGTYQYFNMLYVISLLFLSNLHNIQRWLHVDLYQIFLYSDLLQSRVEKMSKSPLLSLLRIFRLLISNLVNLWKKAAEKLGKYEFDVRISLFNNFGKILSALWNFLAINFSSSRVMFFYFYLFTYFLYKTVYFI